MLTLQRDASARIPYAVQGDGPAIVLINGATLPLAFWDPVAERLASRARVIRFDQRNAGASDFAGSFSLLDVAADVDALLQALDVEQAVVAGHAGVAAPRSSPATTRTGCAASWSAARAASSRPTSSRPGCARWAPRARRPIGRPGTTA